MRSQPEYSRISQISISTSYRIFTLHVRRQPEHSSISQYIEAPRNMMHSSKSTNMQGQPIQISNCKGVSCKKVDPFSQYLYLEWVSCKSSRTSANSYMIVDLAISARPAGRSTRINTFVILTGLIVPAFRIGNTVSSHTPCI